MALSLPKWALIAVGLAGIASVGCATDDLQTAKAPSTTTAAAREAMGRAAAACDAYIAPKRYVAQTHSEAPVESVERLLRSAVSYVREAAEHDSRWRHLQQAIAYLAKNGAFDPGNPPSRANIDDVAAVITYIESVCERLGVRMSGWSYLGPPSS